jgi:GNAT superfamily N-acetyltransferase
VGGLSVRALEIGDIDKIAAAFAAIGWYKPAAQYERYLAEQDRDERDVLVARCDGAFSGYLTIVWHSEYPPFSESGIPEIADLNVLPERRRHGIGARLLDLAERRIADRSLLAGIGVGMDPDYGAAQRLYVKRGYIPDGRGLTYQRRPLAWGDSVRVDDDLVLYFTKVLSC